METSNERALSRIKRPGTETTIEETFYPQSMQPQPLGDQFNDPLAQQQPPLMPDELGMQDPNQMAGRIFTPGVGWKKLPKG